MELTIQNHTPQPKWNRYRNDFCRIIAKTSSLLQAEKEWSLSVIFVQDDEIQEINRTYRNKNVPTDVISFAIRDTDDEFDIPEDNLEIGDIFINIDAVLRQSKDYQHTMRREVCFLFTHGLLHLIGYDHMNEAEEHQMFALQDDILQDIALKRFRSHE